MGQMPWWQRHFLAYIFINEFHYFGRPFNKTKPQVYCTKENNKPGVHIQEQNQDPLQTHIHRILGE